MPEGSPGWTAGRRRDATATACSWVDVDYKSPVSSRQSGGEQSAVGRRTLQLAFMPIRSFGVLVLLLGLAGCAASPKNSASAPAPRLVYGRGAGGRPRLHALQRHVGTLLLPGDHGARRRRCFDYDNDGDLDVYVTQGQMLGTNGPLRREPATGLFRNDTVVNPDGTRTIRFTDVTTQSGIDLRSYGMGVAAGDFNNDGFVDLYRTGLSGAALLRNNGDGTFTDVTKAAGVGDPGGWGVSATFFDYDRDGWLDLFVGNYLIYSLAGDVQCLSVTGRRDYCPPNSYRAQPSHLYHNRGNGTFEDVTAKAFVNGAYGPALGSVDRRLQQRRVDRSLRRQRRPAQPALDQPARRHVQGHGVPGRRRRERHRAGRSEHGRGRGRLRQRRRRGSVHHELARPDERPLPQRRRGKLRRSARGGRPRRAQPRENRFRRRLAGLRSRRLAGSVRRQRRRRDHRGPRAERTIRFRSR